MYTIIVFTALILTNLASNWLTTEEKRYWLTKDLDKFLMMNILVKHWPANMWIQTPIKLVHDMKMEFGLKPEEVLPFIEEIAGFSHIQIKGLMTIAPFVANPEENREVFQKLKKLSVDIAAKNINNVNMSVLSMGMTGDYQVAVQEGATMVRVGTGIFGERNYAR